ncbi:MAG: hypothetical protein PUP91_18735 [Rhizonema sp. PD37]|nr:hypothetical protein [Rhizonema sp. PD37]
MVFVLFVVVIALLEVRSHWQLIGVFRAKNLCNHPRCDLLTFKTVFTRACDQQC